MKSPSIQGLRAIAVLAVVAYHLNWQWIRGGFLGVDLFFVLSGYLITSLAIRELHSTDSFSLTGFIGRRVRRILPASMAVLGAVLVFGHFGRWDSPPGQDVRWASLYAANWHFVLAKVSYGADLSGPSPVLHFWSLAVEEQWYILFPLVMAALGALVVRHRRLTAVVLLLLATLSAVWMTSLSFSTHFDVSRAYFGTDTRIFAILLGACGAMVLPLGSRTRHVVGRRIAFLSLVLGLLVLCVLFVVARERAVWMYRGGFVAAAVASLAAILGVTTVEPRFFRSRILQLVGDHSYSVYLWHWPVIVATRADAVGFDGAAQLALRVALIALLSMVSYRFIETPFLRRRDSSSRIHSARTFALATVVPCLALSTFAFPGVYRRGSVAEQMAELNQAAMDFDSASLESIPQAVEPSADHLSILLVGDSVPFGLAWKFNQLRLAGHIQSRFGITVSVINGSRPGCGFIPNEHNRKWKCSSLTADRTKLMQRARPDIVLLFGGIADQLDLVYDDEVVKMESNNWKNRFEDELRRQLSILGSSGARLVYLKSPCIIDTRPQVLVDKNNNGADENRRAILNEFFESHAATFTPSLTVLDPEELLCPDGMVRELIDGKVVRRDGIHYSDDGHQIFWDWLLPKLLSMRTTPVNSPTTTSRQP